MLVISTSWLIHSQVIDRIQQRLLAQCLVLSEYHASTKGPVYHNKQWIMVSFFLQISQLSTFWQVYQTYTFFFKKSTLNILKPHFANIKRIYTAKCRKDLTNTNPKCWVNAFKLINTLQVCWVNAIQLVNTLRVCWVNALQLTNTLHVCWVNALQLINTLHVCWVNALQLTNTLHVCWVNALQLTNTLHVCWVNAFQLVLHLVGSMHYYGNKTVRIFKMWKMRIYFATIIVNFYILHTIDCSIIVLVKVIQIITWKVNEK